MNREKCEEWNAGSSIPISINKYIREAEGLLTGKSRYRIHQYGHLRRGDVVRWENKEAFGDENRTFVVVGDAAKIFDPRLYNLVALVILDGEVPPLHR